MVETHNHFDDMAGDNGLPAIRTKRSEVKLKRNGETSTYGFREIDKHHHNSEPVKDPRQLYGKALMSGPTNTTRPS